jgi:hypothetical protein
LKLTCRRTNNAGLYSSAIAWGGLFVRKYSTNDSDLRVNTDKFQALVLAHEDSRYANTLLSTRAIIFFGTPHLGSEHAVFFSMLMGIVNAVGSVSMIQNAFGKTRKDLVGTLNFGSAELKDLSMSFTDRTEGIEIISFYEENVMPPFKKLVSCFTLPSPK